MGAVFAALPCGCQAGRRRDWKPKLQAVQNVSYAGTALRIDRRMKEVRLVAAKRIERTHSADARRGEKVRAASRGTGLACRRGGRDILHGRRNAIEGELRMDAHHMALRGAERSSANNARSSSRDTSPASLPRFLRRRPIPFSIPLKIYSITKSSLNSPPRITPTPDQRWV
ncbi:hypothetical protein [Profundibacterium mesophilum]|uniref:hypothetical protein n=1 Tax=Profundibacterium mesophilum TaxID=1258573 RepID=UPI001359050F|nr:hypothetical protein [Profundibacterium mesophilum]